MKGKAPALIAAIALALSPAASAWAQEHHHHGGGGGGGGGHEGGGRGHDGGGRGDSGEHSRGYGGPRYDEGHGGRGGYGGGPGYEEPRGYPSGRQGRGGVEPWMPPIAPRHTEAYRPGGGGRPGYERPPAALRGPNWDGQRYNGYFMRGRWYYGPPPSASYGQPGFQFGFSAWRRGAVLPQYYRGWVLEDYLHYHLRRPPGGYHWVRIGPDFLLVSDGSGLIFDVIQGDR